MLGPINVLLWYVPLIVAPSNQKQRLVGELSGSLARLAAPPAPPPSPAAPVPAPVPAPVASAWPSVDDPLRVDGKGPEDAAVVIGLEDYAFIADVPYAHRDATAFYNTAVYTLGIRMDRVFHLEAGSVEQIRAALRSAGAQVGPGGKVWVYFAGHGAASPVTREQVLLGDDVRADPNAFDTRALPVSEVEALAAAGGGQPVVILDTCFAGQGRGGEDLIAGTRFAVPSYAVSTGGGVQWTAAGPNELSGPLDDAEHGAFTYFMVGALRGWADGELSGVRDGVVTGDEAQAYVRRALKAVQVRSQTPAWVGASGGDVVLSHGTEEGPPLR